MTNLVPQFPSTVAMPWSGLLAHAIWCAISSSWILTNREATRFCIGDILIVSCLIKYIGT